MDLKQRVFSFDLGECVRPVVEPEVVNRCCEGDIWKLGPHLLCVGDSLNSALVRAVVGGQKVDLCLTDPPYGINYLELDRRGEGSILDGRKCPVFDDKSTIRDILYGLFSNCPSDLLTMTFLWHRHLHLLSDASRGWDLLYERVAVKQHPTHVIGRRFQPQHENILYFRRRGGDVGCWNTSYKTTTVEMFYRKAKNKLHPTQKPPDFWLNLMRYQTKEGSVVYDPFLGSGTTLLAAELLGRTCIGFEISPLYATVAIEQWERVAQQRAELVGENGAYREKVVNP